MAVTRRRGKWIVDVSLPQARRIQRVALVQTRKGAQTEERRILEDWLSGPKKKEVKTKEFASEWFEVYVMTNNRFSEQTNKKRMLGKHLVPSFGALCLSEIDTALVERFKARLAASKLKPKTVNNILACLGKMLHTAEEWGYATAEPRIRLLKVPEQRPDFLSESEEARLLRAAEARGGYWLVMVLLGLQAGLRIGEILALRWCDLEFESTADRPHGSLTVRQSAWYGMVSAPKNGRERTVPLTARLHETLLGHRHLRGEFVVCTEEGRLLRQDDVDSGLRAACRRGSVRPMGWHLLRHTFASRLAQRGVPLQAIKELLGHSTLSMTLRYAHLAPSNLAQAVAVLEAPGDVGVTWPTPLVASGR